MYIPSKNEFDMRVAQGVAFLNSNAPEWYKRINLEKLSIGDGKCCALALVWNDRFIDVQKQLKLGNHTAVQLGFLCPQCYVSTLGMTSGEYVQFENTSLTAAWKRAIIALCAGTYVGMIDTPENLYLAA